MNLIVTNMKVVIFRDQMFQFPSPSMPNTFRESLLKLRITSWEGVFLKVANFVRLLHICFYSFEKFTIRRGNYKTITQTRDYSESKLFYKIIKTFHRLASSVDITNDI